MKFSVQDHIIARSRYGYIQVEDLREQSGTHIGQDQFSPGVEYSLNKKKRWEEAQEIKHAQAENPSARLYILMTF